MSIERVVFVQQVPVPGTPIRTEYFTAPEWVIAIGTTEGCIDVRLHRPANPSQNITEVPRFRVVGVGFCVPEEKPNVAAQSNRPRTDSSADAAAPVGLGGDGGRARVGAQSAQGRAPRSQGKVKP